MRVYSGRKVSKVVRNQNDTQPRHSTGKAFLASNPLTPPPRFLFWGRGHLPGPSFSSVVTEGPAAASVGRLPVRPSIVPRLRGDRSPRRSGGGDKLKELTKISKIHSVFRFGQMCCPPNSNRPNFADAKGVKKGEPTLVISPYC